MDLDVSQNIRCRYVGEVMREGGERYVVEGKGRSREERGM